MRSGETRAFVARLTIGQHFGRPYAPTDQAWIETLWGHVKAGNPHLMTITDPQVLAAELERARRRDGLNAAEQARRAHHRNARANGLPS